MQHHVVVMVEVMDSVQESKIVWFDKHFKVKIVENFGFRNEEKKRFIFIFRSLLGEFYEHYIP